VITAERWDSKMDKWNSSIKKRTFKRVPAKDIKENDIVISYSGEYAHRARVLNVIVTGDSITIHTTSHAVRLWANDSLVIEINGPGELTKDMLRRTVYTGDLVYYLDDHGHYMKARIVGDIDPLESINANIQIEFTGFHQCDYSVWKIGERIWIPRQYVSSRIIGKTEETRFSAKWYDYITSIGIERALRENGE
jgi:hypothetical protein